MITSPTPRRIHHVVYTGGPCGGKTTALAQTEEHFSQLGYRVVMVPEAATLLINAGFPPRLFPGDEIFHFQRAFVNFTLFLEKTTETLVNHLPGDEPVLVIHDRGVLDSKAYCPPQVWERIVESTGMAETDLREKNYDAVIHLVTAATGAEGAYSNANNQARSEDVATARAVDLRTQAAWTGHPHLAIIDNSTDFEGKIHRTIAAVCHAIGTPEPLEIEKKYVLSQSPVFPDDLRVVKSAILQTYLTGAEGSERVRLRRHEDGVTGFTRTRKRELSPGKRVEIEAMIKQDDYQAFLQRADAERNPIDKTRSCFIWDHRQYEMDAYHGVLEGIFTVEVEGVSIEEQIELPPFLRPALDVTGNSAWSNSSMARKDWVRPV
jgi:CYTH domain-containing protein